MTRGTAGTAFRRLGGSGLKVSTLCLGALMFGRETDEATAGHIVGRARDAGVNFIDTADVYADGRSEEVVGRMIGKDRDRWVLATKAGLFHDPALATPPDLSRKNLLRAADRSLRRLGTDYIDIYYLHRDDPGTPLEETLRAAADLVRQGKIRYFGLSNYQGWRIAEAVRVCDAMGIERPVACQAHYNALNRLPEVEVIPACAFYGIGVVAYSPLARGVLTGKYASVDRLPPDSRAARGDRRILQTDLNADALAITRSLAAHAQGQGGSLAHFAVRWVLDNSAVGAVIGGPRTLDQWNDYLAALHGPPLTPQDEAAVDRLVAAGQQTSPDPAYPVLGRRRRGPAGPDS